VLMTQWWILLLLIFFLPMCFKLFITLFCFVFYSLFLG
jgi:hypothetical protein